MRTFAMRDVYHKPMRTLALAILLALTSSAHSDPAPESPRDPDRVAAAAAVGALGSASLITGIVLGFKARSDYHAAFDAGQCMTVSGSPPLCDAQGQARAESAYTLGNVGTAFGVAGVALIGAAAITYFTAPRTHTVIVPVADDRGASLSLVRRF
jgi:hypothetical protein